MYSNLIREGEVTLEYYIEGSGQNTLVCFHGHGRKVEDFLFLGCLRRRRGRVTSETRQQLEYIDWRRLGLTWPGKRQPSAAVSVFSQSVIFPEKNIPRLMYFRSQFCSYYSTLRHLKEILMH